MSRHREIKSIKPPAGMPSAECFEIADVSTPAPDGVDVYFDNVGKQVVRVVRAAMA